VFDVLRGFFKSIRYLGPLRDDPKAVYPVHSSIDSNGCRHQRGAHCSVLDLNADRFVEFVKPEEKEVAVARLRNAVELWLQHFSMADSVSTIDDGKLGHRMLVAPKERIAT
jgi:hypothetical protein